MPTVGTVTEITRSQFAVAAILVVAVVLIGSRALGAPVESAPASASRAPFAAARTASAATAPAAAAGGVRVEPAAGGIVVVHVAGRVRRPGLYRLPDGSRIADAVRRAGGRAKHADLDAINLAAKLLDGEQVLVPSRVSTVRAGTAPAGTASAPAAATGPAAIISLNSATAEQLETIDGVGPATAAKILDFRQKNGGFRTVDDLAQISGIGPKRLEAMRPHVRV